MAGPGWIQHESAAARLVAGRHALRQPVELHDGSSPLGHGVPCLDVETDTDNDRAPKSITFTLECCLQVQPIMLIRRVSGIAIVAPTAACKAIMLNHGTHKV